MSDQSQSPKPVSRQRGSQISSVQIMFAAILAIGLILAINFSTRIAAGQPIQQAYDRVLAEIDQLKQEQANLIAERDYARSDAFVEQWARDEGKMVRDGEVLVIPVPAGISEQPTPIPENAINVQTTPPEPEPWTLWWSLFFDDPPPKF
jgi:cell division protein FtsB